MTASEPELDLIAGTVVAGKYRVDELIGRGGMGAVYRATNLAIGKRVALKFLYPEAALDRDAVARFQREAEAASAAESAHIVEIFDSGTTDDGRPFLVMELLRGEDLRQRLRREGRLPPNDAVRIAAQVARALRRAHEAGIVHRDLKPDNVFLCERDDDPMFVKLVDFGISKVARREVTADALTRRGVVLGTAFYMAPEQAQALPDVDGRTDLYSLGAILYEALTGEPPHHGRVYESVLIDICTKDAPPLRERAPDVPEPLARVVHRALERDRSRRYQCAEELHAALLAAAPGAAAPGGEVRSQPLGLVPNAGSGALAAAAVTGEAAAVRSASPPRPRSERRWILAVAVVAILAAASAALVLTGRHRGSTAGERVAADAPASPATPSAEFRPGSGAAFVPAAAGAPGPEGGAMPAAGAAPRGAGAAPTRGATGPSSGLSPGPSSTASARPSTVPRTPTAAGRAPRAGVAGELELATEP